MNLKIILRLFIINYTNNTNLNYLINIQAKHKMKFLIFYKFNQKKIKIFVMDVVIILIPYLLYFYIIDLIINL